MDVSWDLARLLTQELPEEILGILQSCTNGEYIDAIASLALRPTFTSAIFTIYDSLFIEVCSRWLARAHEEHLGALSAVSHIVSLRPHLSVFAKSLLTTSRNAALEALASRKATALQEVQPAILHNLLLSIYRLLAFNNAEFAPYVSPAQVQSLLGHDSRPIRYLAVKILCSYLHASDAILMDMVKKYLGNGSIEGRWEDKTIDYTFLSLWERKRLKDLASQLKQMETACRAQQGLGRDVQIRRTIQPGDLSATSACLGGVLVPRLTSVGQDNGSLVMTTTTYRDLAALAHGINSGKPLLLRGLEGSGKTSLIRHAARMLGMDSSMVTLHLNEQTDAKLLIGMYTNSKNPGSFSWQPGVLTKAARDGRWIMIEDIDRAPAEVLSTLLPLLERRELFIPNWGESVQAAHGFKLIATVRSSENMRGEEIDPTINHIGRRLWSRIAVGSKPDSEIAVIIEHKHPVLHAHIPRMMAVYSALRRASIHLRSIAGTVKPVGPRDLLRWSARVEDLLLGVGTTTGSEPISEATRDDIFLEAVDCFAAAVPSGPPKVEVLDIIARELHMAAKRVEYCLRTRLPGYQDSDPILSIGRVKLFMRKEISRAGSARYTIAKGPFSMTDHVSRILESIAATVKRAQPCLLVGETGTGKTTIVQKLASSLKQRLTVVNLSQQSDAGDLLGGFKPVNMRSLAIPMKEEFNDLLQLTFPSKPNQHYIIILEKAVAKSRWSRALSLWQEALRSLQSHLGAVLASSEIDNEEPRLKKRKVRRITHQSLKSRWDKFATDVESFQMHLSSGTKGFAFSFVEGSIVKAARNGDWVLLDEINLASPDTLESLGDLFCDDQEGGPSLLLSETGNLERIRAHRDFRIFGAMNPATDAGKRDLPPNIRSRFIEIFVEAPDNDLNNLVPVVKAYLSSHAHVDIHLATDAAQLYLEIKKFANENKLADGTDQKTHFSLRTLTRTLNYAIDIAPIYGLRRALFEGFCMCFLTVLNKASETFLQPVIYQRIVGSQKHDRSILHQRPRAPQDGKQYVQFRQYWISQGAVPVEEQSHYVITPFIERNLLNLVRATSTRKFPVLLQGPTSSGKTSMIEHLAKKSGNRFVRINNHEHTDLQEYLGSYMSGPDGRLRYQEGILVQALREGHWIVLDELNLAPPDVLEALNRLLDDNRELFIPETQQTIRPHENFMLFATQNPPGLYGGRKILSRAFRNRFVELHFDDIPEDELETILRERSQIAPSFCTRIVSVYKKLSILRQTTRLFEQRNSFATLRDLFRWALRDAANREQLAVNGFMLLAERVRDADEREIVKNVIEEVMKVKIDEDQIYGMSCLKETLGSPLSAPLGVTWTKSMRRLYALVSQALKNLEPVLLIGETGSGKTTICQVIAEIMRTRLHMVNAHQNMETGDLIGSQRPMRDRSSAQLQFLDALITALESSGHHKVISQTDLETLTRQYETLIQEAPDSISDHVRLKIEQSRTKANALFEWVDGSLIQAMRDGHHYLLDEISLADDSVLERLNSVLEPGRSLLLAEKGSNDVHITASLGFQFLATMNPGGDYGKRELSPALRNRFTEIWVPSVIDEEEMLEIVLAKLPSSLANLARPMVTFAAWYASIYKANRPSISIRDLLTWTMFIDKFQGSCPQLSVLHGAAMVYLDRFGTNPTAQTSMGDNLSSSGISKSLQKLSDLFNYNMMFAYHESPALILDSRQLSIGDFSLKKATDEAPGLQYSLEAPTTKTNTMKIVRALQLQKPILLEGSPGVGKTTLVSALAKVIGMPLTRINLSEQTDLMDLFGSDVPVEGEEAGHFGWRDAPFLRAMQKGEWVLLDEMNLASQSVLEGLNACLDHRGQVYISELDRTFARHANFVVFAAQNPHLQGGGRKGLPESFVNRFTIVYAEAFSHQDLLIICSELFPDVSIKVTESLVGCIEALKSLLQRDERLGALGGPWEFNLRDILRWLHLLTSRNGLLALGDPMDFVNLLFVQRFRTLEDRTIISKMFEERLSPNGPFDIRYHAYDPCVLQVGFAVLPKDRFSRPSLGFNQATHQIDLPISESLMLCVQQSWPCLLVGAPGSGKTTIIKQLAAAVGAELIDVSLNSEMDTVDLVGGFEQLDTERQIVGLVKRVKAYTRKAIMQQMISTATADDDNLLQLEAVCEADLVDLLQRLQSAARCSPLSVFPSFLAECQDLMRQSAVDNRARFEWVDGILVKALKQGKWLVLDNANLCSPSVLDRLNSLLEPNGSLSINEHRNPDGSAKIVKPHPDFRLFMTMDPRHGEMSRAMRNRSLELFMPITSPSPNVDFLGTHIESTVSRFQYVQSFEWSQCDDMQFFNMMSIFLEHLSFSDFDLCHRWQRQVILGLVEIPSSRLAAFKSIISIYQNLLVSRHVVIENIQGSYDAISNELGVGQDLSTLQSIHPFNSPILLSSRNPLSKQLQCLGHHFDLLIKISIFQQKLGHVAYGIGGKTASQMTRLERSLSTNTARPIKDDTTQHIAKLLQGLGSYLSDILNTSDFVRIASSQGFLQSAKELMNYLCDLFELANSDAFDEGIFQTYQILGRSLAAHKFGDQGIDRPASDLAEQMASELDAFGPAWKLYSGTAMEKLWAALKPPTAISIDRLEMCLDIEALADRFDASKWNLGASLRELGILRTSLIAVNASINGQGSPNVATLENVRKTLEDATHQSHLMEGRSAPFFRLQFAMLAQSHVLELNDCTQEERGMLDMLADKPTKASMVLGVSSLGWSLLSQIPLLTAQNLEACDLALVRQVFPSSAICKLSKLDQVPLSSLNLLINEINFLSQMTSNVCKFIGCDSTPLMNQKLGEIRSMAARSLESSEEAVNVNAYMPQIDDLLARLVGKNAMEDTISSETRSALSKCSMGVSSSPRSILEKQRGNTMLQMAEEWIQFFAGLLLLYVPDRPFDPALRCFVEHQRHKKRKVELQDRLDALQNFEKVFSGQTSNYRAHLLQNQLDLLGAEPVVPLIARPATSQLNLLQGEFNNILKSIILRLPNPYSLEAVAQGNADMLHELELLRVNVAKATSRLSTNFRAYEDITKPVVAMLNGLDIGLSLTVLASTQTSTIEEAIAHVCNMTPFLGATPHSIANQSFKDLKNISLWGLDPRPRFLEGVSLFESVNVEISRGQKRTMLETFNSFYQEWKDRLKQDKKENALRSSLYRYRGSQEDDEDLDKADFVQLFPTYEKACDDGKAINRLVEDPKLLAQRLSRLHREIFEMSRTTKDKILGMIGNASSEIASLWSDDLKTSTSLVPAEMILSALILKLGKARDRLQSRDQLGGPYNFYTDANVAEAQKVVALVGKVQTKFRELQEAWPEHATLQDVLRTSNELLSFRHSEPIAKILTKTEQLHSFVYEWQIVASGEFKVTELHDLLSNLLISWRRLELSTWGRLLDMEDEHCKEDSDSWWFVAYEVMIAAPMTMIDGRESLENYVQQLLELLGKLLATTSLGQYVPRLDMIKTFEYHIALLAKEHECLGTVRNALSNFLRYQHRFDNPIKQILQIGRQELEKDMKEILLLASWRDTNIVALRDSANRSHHKLFRIIRRYRALLAQPAEGTLQQTMVDPEEKVDVALSNDSLAPICRVDPRALRLCQQKLSGWSSRPARLSRPDETAQSMPQISRLPSTAMDGATYLDSFATDLIENIRNFQKETRAKASKGSVYAFKHLKSQKRNLYSETLKAVRRMGFRSNLSVDVLKRQDSVEAVLSSSRFFATPAQTNFALADDYFDRFLSLMPQARRKAIKCSADLTNGEALRSIGYLESMLSMLVNQRATLAHALDNFATFEKTFTMVQNLWAPDNYIICLQDVVNGNPVNELCGVFKWLPSILDVGCAILEVHGKLGETASSEVLQCLRQWQTTICESGNEIAQLPKLPSGISTTQHMKTFGLHCSKLEALRAQLQRFAVDFPNMAYIFKQLEVWTRSDEVGERRQAGEVDVLMVSNLNESVSKVSNSILVAMQHMREALACVPETAQDAQWLLSLDFALSKSLRSLYSREIEQMLNKAMAQIRYLNTTDPDSFLVASAIFGAALPILQQYSNIQKAALERYGKFHLSLCRLASILAKTFSQIAQEGFCKPPEDIPSEQDSNEKVEGGTGLGEGEGAEDISKDIRDDEDLSELAQQGKKQEESHEIKDQDSAVNMDRDEMEGEMGDAPDQSDGEDASDGGDESEIHDETGDVDNLDSEAVDEQLWDGSREENQKDKRGNSAKKESDRDVSAASETKGKEADDNGADDKREMEESDMSEDGNDEGEKVAREEVEKMDPHIPEGQHLDLPEEMDIDKMDRSQDLSSEDNEMEELSDLDDKEENKSDTESRVDNMSPLNKDDADKPGIPDGEGTDDKEEDISQASRAGSPVHTKPEDEGAFQGDNEDVLLERTDDAGANLDNVAPSDAQGLGIDNEQTQDKDQTQESNTQGSEGVEGASDNQNDVQASAKDGETSKNSTDIRGGRAEDENLRQKQEIKPFQKLGDALKEWHNQNKQIQDASNQNRKDKPIQEIENTQEDFEHLGHEQEESDNQALGAASKEQAQPLKDPAIDSEMQDEPHNFAPENELAEDNAEDDEDMEDVQDPQLASQRLREQSKPGAFVGKDTRSDYESRQPTAAMQSDYLKSIEDLETDLSLTRLQPYDERAYKSVEEARRLWSHYEAITKDLSLLLTERLRLILAPTLATKMRGDFRTGKRLNIKRVIPYIASNFKRDKIWMRRSIPSKRTYQIMLAVDDSKSMSESESGQLAYQTLALVAKSLSMLEAGEICIVGFGNNVFVAHEFDAPFSAEAGATVVQRFSFQQEQTNVRELVAESIKLFRQARLKTPTSRQDLWQLELIISDGVCEDHEAIKRLVQQATEEHIMIVFVIVDALLKEESIVDMSQALFEPDTATGETKLKIKRYLDDFPFTYYLVVGNVQELPGVLAQALRQWFTEVSEC